VVSLLFLLDRLICLLGIFNFFLATLRYPMRDRCRYLEGEVLETVVMCLFLVVMANLEDL